MSAYCTRDDVAHRLTGDVANLGHDFDATITAIIAMISAELDREVAIARGETYPGFVIVGDPAGTAVAYRYTGQGAPLLLIDDALKVTAVALVDPAGNVLQALTAGIDYLPSPLNGTPITGLRRIGGDWPTTPGGVRVTLVPGLLSAVSDDLHNTAIEEAAQVYLSSQAGGQVASKLLTIRASLFVESYSFAGGYFRRTG